MCGRQLPMPLPAQANTTRPGSAPQGRQVVGAVSARPVGDFLNKIGEGIFVGTFRGTLYSHSTLHASSSAPHQWHLLHEGPVEVSDVTFKPTSSVAMRLCMHDQPQTSEVATSAYREGLGALHRAHGAHAAHSEPAKVARIHTGRQCGPPQDAQQGQAVQAGAIASFSEVCIAALLCAVLSGQVSSFSVHAGSIMVLHACT